MKRLILCLAAMLAVPARGADIVGVGSTGASAFGRTLMNSVDAPAARNTLGATAGVWGDALVVDALTINGGTINATAIGGSTPSTATFSQLRVLDPSSGGSGLIDLSNDVYTLNKSGGGSAGLVVASLNGTTPSAFGMTLWDDANSAAARTTLGLGSGDSATFTAITTTGVTSILGSGQAAPVLQFGGTNFAAPALRRTGATLDVVLADLSAFTSLRAEAVTVNGAITVGTTINGTTPSAFGMTLWDDGDAAAGRATLGAYGSGDAPTFGNVTLGAANQLIWTGRSKIQSSADGNVMLTDNAGTAFGLLRFGGATTSYPALKRNAAILEARLADDSAYTAIGAATLSASPLVNTTGISVLGYSLTGANTVPFISVVGTWNTSGVASGLNITIVDTASAAGSLPFSMKGGATGTTNLFSVDKAGSVSTGAMTLTVSPLGVASGGTGATTLTGLVLGNGTSTMTAVTTSAGVAGALSDEVGTGKVVLQTGPVFLGTADFGDGSNIGSIRVFQSGGGVGAQLVGSAGLLLGNARTISWDANANLSGNADVILTRDASGVLALRNGGTSGTPVPQSFKVYNWGDATNGEWAGLSWGSNVATLECGKNGTGVNREFRLRAGATDVIKLSSTGDLNMGGISFQMPETVGSANTNLIFRSDLNTIGVMSDWIFKWRSVSTGNYFSVGSEDTGLARNAAGIVEANNGTAGGAGSFKANRFIATKSVPTWGSTVTIDASAGDWAQIDAADGFAVTVAAPTNPVANQMLTVTIKNSSGSTLGTWTWNAVWHTAGSVTLPADGKNRSLVFRYNGSAWYEIDRTAADVAN